MTRERSLGSPIVVLLVSVGVMFVIVDVSVVFE